jgi:peptidoglycan/LPS O-acetylase OafA/YrhL
MGNPAQNPPLVSTRVLSLDLLRLLAVLLVLGRHIEPPPTDWDSPLKPFFDAWLEYGWLGVELFFVLSGFLVSGLLFSEYKQHGDISVSRFYLRRGWRIYPAFYFLIGFTYFYELLVNGYKIRDRSIFSELFFIQSYQIPFWNHTWTLAVEEHFYLILPIMLLLLVRRNRGAADPFRAVPYLVGAAAVLILGARILNCLLRPEFSNWTHCFPTHLRIDALFFGVSIGYFYHFHPERFQHLLRPWRYGLIAIGTMLLASSSVLPKFGDLYALSFGFIHYYLGSAALLVGVMLCEIPRHRAILALATLGTFSYSIYLWHMALMRWAVPYLREADVSYQLRTLIYFVGAFVIGIAMSKLLELPTIRLRDRLFPSRSGNVVALDSQTLGSETLGVEDPVHKAA